MRSDFPSDAPYSCRRADAGLEAVRRLRPEAEGGADHPEALLVRDLLGGAVSPEHFQSGLPQFRTPARCVNEKKTKLNSHFVKISIAYGGVEQGPQEYHTSNRKPTCT